MKTEALQLRTQICEELGAVEEKCDSDNLDQYDCYAENPNYTAFFTSLVRSIVSDTRQKIVLDDLDLQDVLQNFSSIP